MRKDKTLKKLEFLQYILVGCNLAEEREQTGHGMQFVSWNGDSRHWTVWKKIYDKEAKRLFDDRRTK